jgi:hypothetical protein
MTLADSAAQRFPAEETESISEVFNVAPTAAPELDGAPLEPEAAVDQPEAAADKPEAVVEQPEERVEPVEDARELAEPELDDRDTTATMPAVELPQDEDQSR